jgi:acetyl/propionyl-CoA carboxylase alpha subunit
MLRALHEYVVVGPTVNVAFHTWALRHPRFIAGDIDTGFIAAEFKPEMLRADGNDDIALIGAAIAATDRARSRNGAAHGAGGESGPRSRWLQIGRREAMRG